VRGTFVVVLGDFNDWLPGRSVVRTLDRRLGRAPRLRSFPVRWPVLSLDRVWVQPRSAVHRLFVHRSQAARLASDHYPVVADIELWTDELTSSQATPGARHFHRSLEFLEGALHALAGGRPDERRHRRAESSGGRVVLHRDHDSRSGPDRLP
jgi:hypothetical protein